MGAGKSTVGALLAERLAAPFVDLDALIVQREGRSIPELFTGGEPAFRRAEAAALRAVLAGPPAVLACGGGAPCQPGLADAMRAWGLTVFLDAPIDELARRLGAGGLVEGSAGGLVEGSAGGLVEGSAGGLVEGSAGAGDRPLWGPGVESLYRARRPLYRTADLTVSAAAPPAEVAERIYRALLERESEQACKS